MNSESLRSLGLSTTAKANDPMQSGADGFVVPIAGRSGDLAKIFPNTKPVQSVLESIGNIINVASPGDRSILENCFALPRTILVDDSTLVPHCVGFTMKAAADSFFHTAHVFGLDKRFLLEMDHLIGRTSNCQLHLPGVTQDDALEIVSLTFQVYSILHNHGFVIQDVSNRNVTWTVLGGPQVLVLDADSIRLAAGPSAVPPKHSPGYTPSTWGPKNQNQESDVYKAALLGGRILSGDMTWPNGSRVLLGQTALDATFRRSVTDAAITNRPTMEGLLDAVEHWDRPPSTAWISLGPPTTQSAQPTTVPLFPPTRPAAQPTVTTTPPAKTGFIPLASAVPAPIPSTVATSLTPPRRTTSGFIPLPGTPATSGTTTLPRVQPMTRTTRPIKAATPALTGAAIAALLVIPALLAVLTR